MGAPKLEILLPASFRSLTLFDATIYITLFIIILAAWLGSRRSGSPVNAPFYHASKLRWMFGAEGLIRDSYRKFPDVPYIINATEGPQVLIPARLLAELRSLPESTLSAVEAVSEALQSRYTGFGAGQNGSHLLSAYVGGRLTHNITRLMPRLYEELEHIVSAEFPPCEEWTPVRFQPFALRAMARISGRATVGAELNRVEEWMGMSINYAVHVFIAVVKLQLFPEWLRPVGQYLVPELGKIQKDTAAARALLEPIIAERVGAGSRSSSFSPSYESENDDMIQFLLDAMPEGQEPDVEMITKLQIIIAAASIHTTNNLLTECMYDLAAHPEAQEILREEVLLEIKHGRTGKDSLAKLEKMDSFIKECQRLTGNITSFIRKVVKPITLSDGTHLPAGTKILAPLAGFSHDKHFFSHPAEFDPLRFYNLCRQEHATDAQTKKWQLTSTAGATNLHFGAGKHACPGRFFGSAVLKMILAYFLARYEVQLKEGEKRPQAAGVVMSKAPNATAELLFRRIKE